jgi:hypothetical protein
MKFYQTAHCLCKLHGILSSIATNLSKDCIISRSFCTSSFVAQKWGTKKQHRNVKLQSYFDSMADPKMEEILAPLRASVKEQVGFVIFCNVSCKIKPQLIGRSSSKVEGRRCSSFRCEKSCY